MQTLSYKSIEDIAKQTLKEYYGDGNRRFRPVNIGGLVTEHLGLNIEYRTLSMDGSILGLTTFDDVAIQIWDETEPYYEFFPKETIVIDKRLLDDNLTGRRNFTISHEGAHQILNNLYPEADKGTKYRVDGKPQTNAEWREWQADALASSLLMPEDLVKAAMIVFCSKTHISLIHPVITRELFNQFSMMCSFLGVSKTALAIRMTKLKLLDEYCFKEPYKFMDIVKVT